jgi:hypothetical protein
MNPSVGRNFEALDPLEWLARMSDHIPDPGQHRTLFCGEYANRTRGARRCPESGAPELLPETPRRRSSSSWARLIARIYQVDPLVCARCGQRMSVTAFLTDHVSIESILDHLGLSTPTQDKPPTRSHPAAEPVSRYPVARPQGNAYRLAGLRAPLPRRRAGQHAHLLEGVRLVSATEVRAGGC